MHVVEQYTIYLWGTLLLQSSFKNSYNIAIVFCIKKWFLGFIMALKVASATFVLVCFLSLNESTCQTRKNVFYSTSKALFILGECFPSLTDKTDYFQPRKKENYWMRTQKTLALPEVLKVLCAFYLLHTCFLLIFWTGLFLESNLWTQ